MGTLILCSFTETLSSSLISSAQLFTYSKENEGIVSPYESATIGVFRDVIDGRVRRVNVSTLRTKLEGQVFITTDEAFSIEDVDNQIGFDKVVIYGRYNRDIGMLEEAEVFGSEDSRFEPYLEDAKFLLRTLEVPEEASRGH